MQTQRLSIRVTAQLHLLSLITQYRYENQLLTFSLNGGQNVDSQYITVNDVADVQVGAKIMG